MTDFPADRRQHDGSQHIIDRWPKVRPESESNHKRAEAPCFPWKGHDPDVPPGHLTSLVLNRIRLLAQGISGCEICAENRGDQEETFRLEDLPEEFDDALAAIATTTGVPLHEVRLEATIIRNLLEIPIRDWTSSVRAVAYLHNLHRRDVPLDKLLPRTEPPTTVAARADRVDTTTGDSGFQQPLSARVCGGVVPLVDLRPSAARTMHPSGLAVTANLSSENPAPIGSRNDLDRADRGRVLGGSVAWGILHFHRDLLGCDARFQHIHVQATRPGAHGWPSTPEILQIVESLGVRCRDRGPSYSPCGHSEGCRVRILDDDRPGVSQAICAGCLLEGGQ